MPSVSCWSLTSRTSYDFLRLLREGSISGTSGAVIKPKACSQNPHWLQLPRGHLRFEHPKLTETRQPSAKKHPLKSLTRPLIARFSTICRTYRTFWETSTQEELTPEASDRPETRLELLTRISSIRFFSTFSSRVELSKVPTINSVAFRGYCSTVAEQPEDYTRIY